MSSQTKPAEVVEKPKKTAKVKAQHRNSHGPCPVGACSHPPIDHRPIAATKDHFCYGNGCMCSCKPPPPRGSTPGLRKAGGTAIPKTYRGAT